MNNTLCFWVTWGVGGSPKSWLASKAPIRRPKRSSEATLDNVTIQCNNVLLLHQSQPGSQAPRHHSNQTTTQQPARPSAKIYIMTIMVGSMYTYQHQVRCVGVLCSLARHHGPTPGPRRALIGARTSKQASKATKSNPAGGSDPG